MYCTHERSYNTNQWDVKRYPKTYRQDTDRLTGEQTEATYTLVIDVSGLNTKDRETNRPRHRQTDKRTVSRTDKRTFGQTKKQVDRQKDSQTYKGSGANKRVVAQAKEQ